MSQRESLRAAATELIFHYTFKFFPTMATTTTHLAQRIPPDRPVLPGDGGGLRKATWPTWLELRDSTRW